MPLVGGKNASLGEMVRHLAGQGVKVPAGFATTSDAYWRFVKANGLRDIISSSLNDLEAGKLTLAEDGASRLFHPIPLKTLVRLIVKCSLSSGSNTVLRAIIPRPGPVRCRQFAF